VPDQELPGADRWMHGGVGQGAGRLQGAMLLTDPQTCIEISVTLRKTEAEREATVDGGFYDEKIEKFAALPLTGPRSASTTTSA